MTISYLISSLLAYSFACLLASKAHLMLCAWKELNSTDNRFSNKNCDFWKKCTYLPF
jgi:hypothetical protein